MIRKVAKYIDKHRLLKQEAKVIVALSGGADSVALLLLLQNLGYNCTAAHCNFHLRGDESMRDEHFVRSLCERLGVHCSVKEFDTKLYAAQNGISIEMAARDLRYEFFEQERINRKADAIAVAHHRDDSAETLLLNLIRGTGIRGLHGIRPINGYIVRPLLGVSRKEILEYLQQQGEAYVTDSTNLTTDYTRNKIRLELLPLMQQINPSAIESIAATAERIAEAEKIYCNAIAESEKRVKEEDTISIKALLQELSPATVLFELLSPYGFNSTQTNDIFETLNNDSSKQFISDKRRLIKEREKLIISKIEERKDINETLPEEGKITTPSGSLWINRETFDGNITKSPDTACLDIDKLHLPLRVRYTRHGDRFKPFGMKGSKLVSDYLTDRKRTTLEKEEQLVITDAKDSIVWLVGERPAAPYCITNGTKEILRITWKKR